MGAAGGWAESLPADPSLEGASRLLFAVWSWNWRNAEPFVIESSVDLGPLVSLAAACALRRTALRLYPRDATFWSLACVTLVAATVSLLIARSSISTLVVLSSATCAAQAIAIGVAYGVQRVLHERSATRVPGYAVLWAGVILQSESIWFGFTVTAVPLLCQWLSTRSRISAT